MEINIKNKNLPVCRNICRTNNTFATECDVIIPDSKPDILKVLQLSARPKITNCETRSGRVIVSGSILFNILYLADGEEKCVKSINSSCEFSNVVREDGIEESMLTFSDVDVSELNCSIVNCRKLSVKASLCMNLQVYSCYELELISEIEGACTKMCSLNSGVISAHAQSSCTLTDSFELSSGKEPIDEILKADGLICGSEIKVIENKAIIKGTLDITVLYKTESSVEYARTELPFAHVLEADGISDEMDIEYIVRLLDIDAVSSENPDGCANVIELSAELFFRVIARSNYSAECVGDAFIPHAKLECKYCTVSVDNTETVIKRDAEIREKLIIPDSLPPIDSVYEVIARPFVENCSAGENSLRLSGYTEVYILYLSNDLQSPICSYKTNLDFSVTCDSPGCMITPFSDCMLRNISYTLSSDRSVEIRASIDVNIQCVRTVEESIVYSAEEGECSLAARPSIIVSCVSSDRSLWDIAKEYCVEPQAILSANALESEKDMPKHMSLIIPK